jgi:chemotaxis protein MotB
MARRKRHHEEHTNHEAWAIPYGDLITLLLAFFVVMYAISSVNEGKFRVLSDSLVAAFRGTPMAPEPIQVGHLARALQSSPAGTFGTIVPMDMEVARMISEADDSGWDLPEGEGGEGLEGDAERLFAEGIDRLAERISAAMMPLIDADLIRMRREQFWIEVEINTELLFASGSAALFPEARPVLDTLSDILRDLPVRINVEGFTDNLPISTPAFPSNWELSGARASSVIRLFAENGLNPAKMAAVGFGEHRPISDNDTPEGRSRNRRVTIVILADFDRRVGEVAQPESLREDVDRGPEASLLER